VVAASLSKTFGVGGAVLVLPDEETARLIRACGSTLIFSGPMQPALVGAAIASARIHLSSEIHERQAKLMDRIRLFNRLAAERNVPLGSAEETPIRFVSIGDTEATYRIASELMNEGFYTNSAVFPAVAKEDTGVRAMITLHQTADDISGLVDAIARRL